MRRLWSIAWLPTALLFFGLYSARCTVNPVAGGGTDSPNLKVAAVSGTVKIDSAGASGIRVSLRPANHLARIGDSLPQTGMSRVDIRSRTDGGFTFDSIVPGEYFLELNNDSGLASGIRVSIYNDSILDPLTLQRSITIHGSVREETPSREPIYVQIFGMGRYAQVDPTTGEYHLAGLPPASIVLRFSSPYADLPIEERGIQSPDPGDSLEINVLLSSFPHEEYQTWLYNKTLYLNTTASGAGVAEDVPAFPVLVRLDSTNFQFAQSLGDGRDIRFARGTTRLRYEIDSWDSAAYRGAVWVLADTVRGNDSTGITMYWGNPNAQNFSNPAAVFDTSNGFAGVWHMEVANLDVPDATAHRNSGGARNYDGDEVLQGLIGNAVKSDDGGAHIRVENAPSLQLRGPLTLSAWVKGQGYGHFLSKGETGNREYSLYFRGTAYTPEAQIARSPVTSVYAGSAIPSLPDTWNFVAFVYDGTRLSFQTNDHFAHTHTTYSGQLNATTLPLMLQSGSGGGNRLYRPIDEIRISTVARSAAWLRLCWQNQRPGGVLVELGQ